MVAHTKYTPDMPEKVVKYMRMGYSRAEVTGKLGLKSRDTLYDYIKKYPEFAAAVEEGDILSQMKWEREGRQNLYNKDFNNTMWIFQMKNRFGWKDKTETTTTGNVNVTHELKDYNEIKKQYEKDI